MKKANFATPGSGRRAELGQNPGRQAPTAGGQAKTRKWNKWALLRMVGEIKHVLEVNDRSLSLLAALLSFHPETEWSAERLGQGVAFVVFPSNRNLSQRAHGMAEKTMRRHLGHLISAGLVIRRDSPNGKRYARRTPDGGTGLAEAFGFDLSPLLAQAEMFERQSRWEQRRKAELAALKEAISLLRRDVDGLLVAAAQCAAAAELERWRVTFQTLLAPVRRLASLEEARNLAAQLEVLKRELRGRVSAEGPGNGMAANHGHSDRHQSESETDYFLDSDCLADEAKVLTNAAVEPRRQPTELKQPALTLELVLKACPDLGLFQLPGATITSWNALSRLALVLRPALGVSSQAWDRAKDVMGDLQAAAALSFILQRSEFSTEQEEGTLRGERPGQRRSQLRPVRSPGGYLRRLTEEARRGSLQLAQVLHNLMGHHVFEKRQVGVSR